MGCKWDVLIDHNPSQHLREIPEDEESLNGFWCVEQSDDHRAFEGFQQDGV